MKRQWRQPDACSRNSTVRPICAAFAGDSRRCQYAYIQLSTIDDARPRFTTDRNFTGARRRKFWTFQNFRTATAAIGAQCRSAAFTHGCVSALWRSTAFIHGFWTAAERRQKPPMCNSGLSDKYQWATNLSNFVFPNKFHFYVKIVAIWLFCHSQSIHAVPTKHEFV